MLIPFNDVRNILLNHKISVDGVFHLGSHTCEELPFYNYIGVANTKIVWVDALAAKVAESRSRGIPNVFHAVITDKDDEDVAFHVSNNVQSSSVLEFGTHAQEHPHVFYVDTIQQKSITVDSFFERNGIDASHMHFWNLDIQGAELLALQGATRSLKYAKVIYLEVNEKELYRGCGLMGDMDAFLSLYGFKRVWTHMTEHGWGDAIYILE
jgi:FkbM family methyltransferase